MPTSADSFEGQNYKDVITKLQGAGFTNIEDEPLGDLIIGWLHDEGEVKEISCNGETDFLKGDTFTKDAKIVIRYHSHPEKETADSDEQDSKKTADADQKGKDTTTSKIDQKDNKTVPSETDTVDNETSPSEADTENNNTSPEDEILNVENCPELAEVFHVSYNEDPIIDAFAQKYAGEKIEFDGFIFECYNHVDVSPFSGKETVREYYFDVFPIVGNKEDGDDPLLRGASLKMKNVSSINFPAIFTDKNVHIVAEVVSYGDPYFLQLNPISIEER